VFIANFPRISQLNAALTLILSQSEREKECKPRPPCTERLSAPALRFCGTAVLDPVVIDLMDNPECLFIGCRHADVFAIDFYLRAS
jgi:hypothetical protein